MQAIFDAPDEDGPRLVYADWLEENAEPGGIDLQHAALIRAQIAGREPEMDTSFVRRALGVFVSVSKELHPLTGKRVLTSGGFELRRGFIDRLRLNPIRLCPIATQSSLDVDPEEWMTLARHPIRHLSLGELLHDETLSIEHLVDGFRQSPMLERLESLDFEAIDTWSIDYPRAELLGPLLRGGRCLRLRRLELCWFLIGRGWAPAQDEEAVPLIKEWVELVCESPLPALRTLVLCTNHPLRLDTEAIAQRFGRGIEVLQRSPPPDPHALVLEADTWRLRPEGW
jgi:uncharacterized protein (TIGR02996 family)